MKSIAVRQQFLDFFESKNHHTVSSAPMVVKDDPTLMRVGSSFTTIGADDTVW